MPIQPKRAAEQAAAIEGPPSCATRLSERGYARGGGGRLSLSVCDRARESSAPQPIREAEHVLRRSGAELAPENDAVEPEIRQLLYGRRGGVYRALFTITGSEVRVFHIRHAVRQAMTAEELRDE